MTIRRSHRTRWHRFVAAFALAVGVAALEHATLLAQAAALTSVTPAAARSGEVVTLTGEGLGAINVRITVGGVPAAVLTANGHQVTFRVPDAAPPGPALLVAVNPGGRTGTIGFTVLEGILLPGSPGARAIDTIVDRLPVGVAGTAIENGLILTRLDLRLAQGATVGQLDAALIEVEGGIVSMSRGFSSLTIAVPRQDSVDALERLAAHLDAMPGIGLAKLAHATRPLQIFTPADFDGVAAIRHLLPSRFPAAWNATGPALLGAGPCPVAAVPVLVADFFSSPTPDAFSSRIPSFRPAAPPLSGFAGDELTHGYTVALTLAANGVGANPFPRCLDLLLVQAAGVAPNQDVDSIVANMPSTGKFIVNYSLGYGNKCAGLLCQPPHDVLRNAIFRGDDALYWKEKTHSRWSDFLMVVAAGNERAEESALIYPGMGNSRFGAKPAISQLPDPLFQFVGDQTLWSPAADFQALGFDSLVSSPGTQAGLMQAVANAGLAGPDAIADNVIVVGSATSPSRDSVLSQHVTPEQLGEAFFSNREPDVLAVGEDVFDQQELTGTSVAAPQVAGLASYLWMLAPQLKQQPAAMTKQTIVANTRNKVIDAYASVLSLDAATLPGSISGNAPIRAKLLDVDGDGGFTGADIDEFLRHLFVVDPQGTITRQAAPGVIADFSRYDLNGDGFTTAGARRERFDLDRVGSTQFGATVYAVVTQKIEDQEIHFDETALTDLEILCYYAYSPLYQGDPDARKGLLAGRCGISVEPAKATVHAGQQQQFTANVAGGEAVTWTVTGGGTIDSKNGVFTAGHTAGSFTVRATNSNDSNQFGEATVVVQSGNSIALLLRDCSTQSVGITGQLQTVLDARTCPEYLNAQGSPRTPPPPYSAPNVLIGAPAGGGVFTYSANYLEQLSQTEVETNAISGGTLDVVAEADAAMIQPGQATNPAIVSTASSASMVLRPLDAGVYQLTLGGQISADFSFSNRVVLTVSFNNPNWPSKTVSLDLSSGGFGTPISQPFTVSQLLSINAVDPATDEFLPQAATLNLVASAEISANAVSPRTSKSEISLTFTLQKVQ